MATLDELAQLSAHIGNDITLIQGAGGNTSIKDGETLWVKASGKWLSRALSEPLFVGVALSDISHVTHNPELRPSIETSLHAAMPHKVVVHVHSVNTIAWAVQAQGKQALSQALDGLSWQWIPYTKPGHDLTSKITECTQDHPCDVLILANHGLVIGAEDCLTAIARLDDVEKRLTRTPRTTTPAKLDALKILCKDSEYRLPQHSLCHQLALDPQATDIAAKGVLYPDHVVFLGTELPLLPAHTTRLPETVDSPFIVIEGKGVLVRNDISAGAEAMVEALAHVTTRIDPNTEIQYLSTEDIARLLNWDAEKYRQQLNQR